jgi:hypothetical protein
MVTDKITETLERLQIKAELLLEENKKAFVRDIYNNYYFCEILIVGEKYLSFVPFKGKQQGEKITEYWVDISEIKEYEEKEE